MFSSPDHLYLCHTSPWLFHLIVNVISKSIISKIIFLFNNVDPTICRLTAAYIYSCIACEEALLGVGGGRGKEAGVLGAAFKFLRHRCKLSPLSPSRPHPQESLLEANSCMEYKQTLIIFLVRDPFVILDYIILDLFYYR